MTEVLVLVLLVFMTIPLWIVSIAFAYEVWKEKR